MTPISVTTLNNQIKALLEATFMQVGVVGEVGRVTHHTSGHVYFSIKDENSTIDCVLFRGNASRLKFRLEQGMRVVVYGTVTVYTPQGRYQINCLNVEPDGAGALAIAYEQLKKKLAEKGWFDEAHKKPLVKYPQTVALVTSATGAALQDMLNVAERRWRLTKLICVNTLVQGEMAPASIVRSIKYADTLGADAIVVGRGGGSMEDLWCFNDEAVAQAIFEAKTPIVSAVGHEIDYVISDFVADKRAATPSAAMEMILPDQNEELIRSDELRTNISRLFLNIISQKTAVINHLRTSFAQLSLTARFKRDAESIAQTKAQLDQAYRFIVSRNDTNLTHLKTQLNQIYTVFIARKESDLINLRRQLDLINPANRLKEKTAQVTKNGKVLALKDLSVNDEIALLDSTTKVTATVKSVVVGD